MLLPPPIISTIVDFLFPPPTERIPLNEQNWGVWLLPELCLFSMACLARKAGTWPLRLVLLPVAVTVTLRASYGYTLTDPELMGANHAIGELSFPKGSFENGN